MPTLHHTGLTISDLERSLRFWRDGMGMEVLFEQERPADTSKPSWASTARMSAWRIWLSAGRARGSSFSSTWRLVVGTIGSVPLTWGSCTSAWHVTISMSAWNGLSPREAGPSASPWRSTPG